MEQVIPSKSVAEKNLLEAAKMVGRFITFKEDIPKSGGDIGLLFHYQEQSLSWFLLKEIKKANNFVHIVIILLAHPKPLRFELSLTEDQFLGKRTFLIHNQHFLMKLVDLDASSIDPLLEQFADLEISKDKFIVVPGSEQTN